MKTIVGTLAVFLACSPVAFASASTSQAKPVTAAQAAEEYYNQLAQAEYEQAMGYQYDEGYVDQNMSLPDGVTAEEAMSFLGMGPGHGGGGHGGGGHGGGGGGGHHGGGGGGGGHHGGGGGGGGHHGGGGGGGHHGGGGYHGRPGWHEGHHWDHGAWHPHWWRVGFRFPAFFFIIGVPHGYWQCNAYNAELVRFAAFGPSLDEAAYNALYDCGGTNPQAAGCYIPDGQCQFFR